VHGEGEFAVNKKDVKRALTAPDYVLRDAVDAVRGRRRAAREWKALTPEQQDRFR
jgi:hypothetical protein